MRNIIKLVILLVLVLVGCRAIPPQEVPWPTSAEDVTRGHYLASSIAACGFCHGDSATPGATLSGGRAVHDDSGELRAANLTPAASGLGAWSPREIMSVLRGGLRPDGTRISAQVHDGLEWMSEGDLLGIVAYLHSLPAVEHDVARPSMGWGSETARDILHPRREVRGFVPEIEPRFVEAYGEYLVDHVARCGSCHNAPTGILGGGEYLAGGRTITTPAGERVAPGISGSKLYGIGAWSEKDIFGFLETGRAPGGRVADPAFCPTDFYRRADKGDLMAIARYLRSRAE